MRTLALTQSKDVLELRRIQVEQTKADRWNGQLPQNVYAGAPIPFFNPSNIMRRCAPGPVFTPRPGPL